MQSYSGGAPLRLLNSDLKNLSYLLGKIMQQYLKKVLSKQDLSAAEITNVGELLVAGTLSEAQSAALLMGLAMKGETVEEIVGLVKVLRQNMKSVTLSEEAIDTCGTGGDNSSTINVSTLSALVCAAAGVPVAKHGNRAVSSRCGSFDLLEQFGIKIDLSPEQAVVCFSKTNLVFLFAPFFHPAFKYIVPVRRAMGIRTIFNFLGPLLNPANVKRQIIGVAVPEMAQKLGEALMQLGSERILIVHSNDSLDEVSIAAPTQVFEFNKNQKMKKYYIEPAVKFSLSDVQGGEPAYNKERSLAILAGQGSAAENEFVALNSGLALYLADIVPTSLDGRKKALEILQSGKAAIKLAELIKFTNNI